MKSLPMPPGTAKLDISVRPLREGDLPAADHIMRLAFGTFLGLPEPASFMGDASYVRGRWRADPDAAFGAEVGGELVGSNFATNWGSVGFFGPLTIRPDLWDRGVGKRLMEPVMECFARWGTAHAGLFTFAQSQKHVGLYQRFGFWPRFLTAIMSKPVERVGRSSQWTRFSEVQEGEREAILGACRQLTNEIYEGLDVSGEINAVASPEARRHRAAVGGRRAGRIRRLPLRAGHGSRERNVLRQVRSGAPGPERWGGFRPPARSL